ncbi:MAG TPA: hypothetical protein VLB29_05020 [Nocardioidaceae bacterium]|nr:hypothetical protein [Nocardioidaceae bacterium]
MAGTEFQRRRFITRHDVEDAAAAGRSIRVQGRDVLTDEAAQRALDLGVAIERDGPGRVAASPATAAAKPSAPSAPSSPSASVSPEELRRAVRAAVIAELGSEPPGLDAAIDRVLRRRGG